MSEAVIVDAVRTPRGKRKGSLSSVHAVDLAAHVLEAALARTGVAPERVEDVVLGCVTQVGEQAFDVARAAVLAAGLPISVPGKTVNRLCGSGLSAVVDMAQAVMAGQIELGLAGWRVEDVDLWEINEAFAPVPIVVGQELGIPLDRINVQGGAIALGHPLGATGAMLVATLLGALERLDLRRGAVTLCIGYGMGITVLLERPAR